MPVKDITGAVYNRLKVLGLHDTHNGYARWDCRCECGNEVVILGTSLRNGNTQSCGCLGLSRLAEGRTKHGFSGRAVQHPLYKRWSAMKDRCYNPKCPVYKWYGAKGVRVCVSWLTSFSRFLAEVGESPFKGAELDRIDNTGDYEPSNVRWATRAEQVRNTSSNRHVELEGTTLCFTDAAKKLGITVAVLRRLVRDGNIKEVG